MNHWGVLYTFPWMNAIYFVIEGLTIIDRWVRQEGESTRYVDQDL